MNVLVKRTSSIFLAATMVLPLSPSFAAQVSPAMPAISTQATGAEAGNVKHNKTEALAIATKFAKLPSGMKLTNTSFRAADQWRPFPEWSFHWTQATEGKLDGASINVSINADTGELTNYSNYENERTKTPTATRIEAADAEKIALQFLQQNAGNKTKQVTLQQDEMPKAKPPLSGNVTYSFTFVQDVDGIPFLNNNININVNGEGKVTYYGLNWDDRITFSKPQQTIDQADAVTAFRSKAMAKPAYIIPWETYQENRNKPEASLVYHSPFSFYIDAQSGEPLQHSLKELKPGAEPVAVSKQPLAPLHTGAQMSQDDAIKLVKSLFDLSGYELRGASYHENDYRGSKSVWGINFEKEGKTADQRSYVFVNIDANSGDILNYSIEIMNPTENKTEKNQQLKMNKQQAQKAAIDSLRKWSPSIASELYLIDRDTDSPEPPDINYHYSVQFERLIDGIPAASGTANLSFDLATGTLRYYYVDLGDEKYPSKVPDHLSSQEAIDKWLEETKVDLVYVLPSPDVQPYNQSKKDGEQEAKLVYRASITPSDPPYAMDAITGDWMNLSNGSPYVLHRVDPEDIKGHPAEKALMLMYEYDAISLIDGKIMPNRPITRGEMIEMLVITFNQGRFYPQKYALMKTASFADVSNSSPYFAYVEAAVEQGLLDATANTLKPDEQISRAELAEMLVRALGYTKLAEYDKLFSTEVSDLTDKKYRGAVAIITTLGIMTADNHKFRPAENVSRADAAVAFSRFLDKRAELDNHNGSPYGKY